MKTAVKTLCSIILTSAFSANAEQACEKIPADWKLEMRAKSGSLCADVLLKADEEGSRKLRVFESGKPAFDSDAVALCKTCGGVKGDPFQSLEWRGRTLSVGNWGGSRFTWDETWKIAEKNNRWQLIGWERGVTDSLTLSNWTESVNTLTRKAITAYRPGESADCREVADKVRDCDQRKPKAKTLTCNLKEDSSLKEINRIANVREQVFACGLKMP